METEIGYQGSGSVLAAQPVAPESATVEAHRAIMEQQSRLSRALADLETRLESVLRPGWGQVVVAEFDREERRPIAPLPAGLEQTARGLKDGIDHLFRLIEALDI